MSELLDRSGDAIREELEAGNRNTALRVLGECYSMRSYIEELETFLRGMRRETPHAHVKQAIDEVLI